MAERGSVSFDRASGYYDSTRSLSAQAMAMVMAQVAPELKGTDCLEVGVGTGRFGIPLLDAGARMFGVDISSEMLARLVEKAADRRFPLVTADATALPFAPESFDTAVAIHVLHLIPAWEGVLDELVRVLRPGGKILIDPGGWGRGSWKLLQEIFCAGAGIEANHPGANSPHAVDDAMVARGARVRLLDEVMERKKLPYRHVIKLLEDGLFSFTWRTDTSGRRRGAEAIRRYLADNDRVLDDTMNFEMPLVWRVYQLPPSG